MCATQATLVVQRCTLVSVVPAIYLSTFRVAEALVSVVLAIYCIKATGHYILSEAIIMQAPLALCGGAETTLLLHYYCRLADVEI